MKDDILQVLRDAFPAKWGISDNDAESRKNAGAEKRESAASSTSEANDLPDGLMDVPQVAEYLRVSKKSVYKLIDRLKIPAIRIGGLKIRSKPNKSHSYSSSSHFVKFRE